MRDRGCENGAVPFPDIGVQVSLARMVEYRRSVQELDAGVYYNRVRGRQSDGGV